MLDVTHALATLHDIEWWRDGTRCVRQPKATPELRQTATQECKKVRKACDQSAVCFRHRARAAPAASFMSPCIHPPSPREIAVPLVEADMLTYLLSPYSYLGHLEAMVSLAAIASSTATPAVRATQPAIDSLFKSGGTCKRQTTDIGFLRTSSGGCRLTNPATLLSRFSGLACSACRDVHQTCCKGTLTADPGRTDSRQEGCCNSAKSSSQVVCGKPRPGRGLQAPYCDVL